VGQIHFRAVTLDELIARSPVIAVVRGASPLTRELEIPIENGPPFVRSRYRFEVLELLRGTAAGTLEVDQPDHATMLRLHREYHERGLSRHPVLQRYPSPVTALDREPFIAFLRPTNDGWSLAIGGGFEALAARADILARLARLKA
jgi:hypothetical protein